MAAQERQVLARQSGFKKMVDLTSATHFSCLLCACISRYIRRNALFKFSIYAIYRHAYRLFLYTNIGQFI